MDILSAAPDMLAKYVTFVIGFSRAPIRSLASGAAETAIESDTISGKLITFALLSVGAAFVIVQLGSAIGMADDPSWLVQVSGGIDDKILPLAALVLIVAGSIAAHVVVKVISFISVVLGHQLFRGSVSNSVNAALAFAAWSLPIVTAVVVALRVVARSNISINPAVFAIVSIPLGIAFWFYLVAAFAGAHRISFGQASSLFGFTVAVLIFAGGLFD